MVGRNYNPAFEAYQQAVYRDGSNPSFWNAVGELYYNINQIGDAHDAYWRGIHLSPHNSELWFNVGKLYELAAAGGRANLTDAIYLYSRARELDPSNLVISQRLRQLTDRVNRQQQDINNDKVSSASVTSIGTEEVDDEEDVITNDTEVVDSACGDEDYNDDIPERTVPIS
jgi:tetratricopeptide (TPR) repeat protein